MEGRRSAGVPSRLDPFSSGGPESATGIGLEKTNRPAGGGGSSLRRGWRADSGARPSPCDRSGSAGRLATLASSSTEREIAIPPSPSTVPRGDDYFFFVVSSDGSIGFLPDHHSIEFRTTASTIVQTP